MSSVISIIIALAIFILAMFVVQTIARRNARVNRRKHSKESEQLRQANPPEIIVNTIAVIEAWARKNPHAFLVEYIMWRGNLDPKYQARTQSEEDYMKSKFLPQLSTCIADYASQLKLMSQQNSLKFFDVTKQFGRRNGIPFLE